jgi:dTDP-glucose 4,6-dehydratase
MQQISSTQVHRRVLITGGAGFIGSNLVRLLLSQNRHVYIFDKLTYAGHRESLADYSDRPELHWHIADLCDLEAVQHALHSFQPDAIVHLAAESHVDRSIAAPIQFAQSNVLGTVHLLEATRQYLSSCSAESKATFRMIHVSTDEVFGSADAGQRFDEQSPYRPNSPYAASKAAADHFVRAFRNTYQLPVHITNFSNNYGPFQHPEKLIPVVISQALSSLPIPVYGDGRNVRDWQHVDDHCRAIVAVLENALPKQDYMIGAYGTMSNIDLVRQLCQHLDQLAPRPDKKSYAELVQFVPDRPGHDLRYDVNASRITQDLDWSPTVSLSDGLRATVNWYLTNRWWWEPILARHKETQL